VFKYRNIKKDAYQLNLCLQQKWRRRESGRYKRVATYLAVVILLFWPLSSQGQSNPHIIKKKEIRNGISPKSVVASGTGYFAAQNMMYRHTITIYDEHGNSKAKIRDKVNLAQFGFTDYESDNYLGGPVEGVFTNDGNFLWVSNYNMVGEGFDNPGCDACIGKDFDPGFLYKINMSSYSIDNVVKVGSIPKFMAISEDEKKLVVSNWTSSDISIVDLETEKEIKKVHIGAHPRGIDITADSKTAVVTVMGSNRLAEVDLETYDVNYIQKIGRSPRQVILANSDSLLYVSLNSGNRVLQYNRYTTERKECKTPAGPRSMIISPDEEYLYVVNYFDNSFCKIRSEDMSIQETVETGAKPIGICANWDESEIWVACYSGKIEIFKDFHLDSLVHGSTLFGFDLSDFWTTKHKTDVSVKENLYDEVEDVTDTSEEKMEGIVLQPLLNSSSLTRPNFSSQIKKTNDSSCKYHIIVGSFAILSNAEKRKNEIISQGYEAVVIEGKELNYVSAQCFSERGNAENNISIIREDIGIKGWVLKR
jgi:YVTN family beta-propeller protein